MNRNITEVRDCSWVEPTQDINTGLSGESPVFMSSEGSKVNDELL